ncbi:MAG: beta strand repeat-containing protein [Immundisolibacter sp.]|uniref:beta strand repeat-containing protein n=1 Tax=Immundisolibacter sp. TaxID=1934948 RepID=UPI003D0CC022
MADGNVRSGVGGGDANATDGVADTAGADGVGAITWTGAVGSTVAGSYGTLTVGAGGAYSYVLDNSLAAVQALDAGQSLTETFGYTLTDGDGDPSSATLTVTINGANDGVTITGIGSAAGDRTVNENDLPGGTSPDNAALTQSGTFSIQALDGIAAVTVGGTVLTLAQLQGLGSSPVTVETPYGSLTLTGFSGTAAGGSVSYRYTLDTTVDNDSQPGANTTQYLESVAVSVTDEDGSAASSAVTIRIVDDAPLVSGAQSAATVDEDGLGCGIAGGVGDVPGTATVASGNVLGLFASGADAPLSYSLAGNTVEQLAALALKSGGVSLAYSVSGDTVTATRGAGGASVFTFELTAGGTYTFTLTGPLDHATGNAENDLTLNLGGLVVATDADGDSVAAAGNGLIITIDDDSPAAFAPDPAAVLDTNIAPTPFNLNLALGADGLGSAVFDIANNGMLARDVAGNLLKLGGQQLYLFGDGTGTLIGTTSSTGVGGTVAFTVTLNPLTNTYTVDVNGTISNGTEFSVSNLTSAAAGNVDFRGIGVDSTAQAVDILFSARSADGSVGTVNTSNTTIGVDSQSINAGAAVRMDFVTNLTAGVGGSGFNYTGHQSALSFKQVIPQVQGAQANTVSIVVAAIVDTTNDQTFPSTLAGIGTDPNESLAAVTGVTVWEGTTARVFTADGTLGGITVDFRVDGTVLIAGLQEGDSYQIRTSTPFQAVLVEAPSSNNNISFDLGAFSLETVNDRSPVNLAFEVDAADADGDAVSGTLSLALLPDQCETVIGNATGQTLNGDADSNNLAGLAGTDTVNGNAGNDFLLGGAGNDILVGGTGSDVLYGQTGSDSLTGGIGGADTVSDRFVFQRGDVGHGVDTITDFKVAALGAGGDVLDIGDLLTGAGISPATFEGSPANYLVVTAGTNTTIAFDADGAGAGAAVQIATLQNVNTTLNTLLANGQIDATP